MRKYLYALDNLEKVDKIKRSFKRHIVYISVGRSVNLIKK